MKPLHSERKNYIYSNPDIVQERSDLNIHFRRCEGTYTQKFDQLLVEKTISTRGLKQDADVFAEMVFDVNTAYFEEHGGYEYAKDFFTEALQNGGIRPKDGFPREGVCMCQHTISAY